MLKTKLLSLALVGVLTVSGTSVFASNGTTEETNSFKEFNQTLKENGRTLDGVKTVKENLYEKGFTLEDAKLNFEEKLMNFANEAGLTLEEAKAQISELKENSKTFEGMKNAKENLYEKGLTLEDAKVNFEEKLMAFANEAGLTLEEAKAQISKLKENSKTFEGMKNAKDSFDAKNSIDLVNA